MYKSYYIRILSVIEDVTASEGKFDFDKALDGTYDFNVNDVSILYELVHTIETIAASMDGLNCTKQKDSLLKEFKYQYNNRIYQVSRYYTHDECTCITGSTSHGTGDFVPEKDFMERVEEKCKIIKDRLNMVYEERSKVNTAG